MRQVPVGSTFDLIIGRGRIATHLSHFLRLSEHPYPIKQWHRDQKKEDLSDLIASARSVFLCINDDALSEFLLFQPEKSKFVHFSGSQSFSDVLGAHPLMTFSTELYTKDIYEQIPFVMDQGVENFKNFFPTLKNKIYSINPEQKYFYHALCVLSGNFTTVLWSALAKEMHDRLHLPEDILNTYLAATAQNTLKNKVSALTGPLARGDQKVIEAHLSVLAGTQWQGLYQNLLQTYERLQS